LREQPGTAVRAVRPCAARMRAPALRGKLGLAAPHYACANIPTRVLIATQVPVVVPRQAVVLMVDDFEGERNLRRLRELLDPMGIIILPIVVAARTPLHQLRLLGCRGCYCVLGCQL
jgi:hypothetical protein